MWGQRCLTLSSLVFPTFGGPAIATIPSLSNTARMIPAWKVIIAMFPPQLTDSMYISPPNALRRNELEVLLRWCWLRFLPCVGWFQVCCKPIASRKFQKYLWDTLQQLLDIDSLKISIWPSLLGAFRKIPLGFLSGFHQFLWLPACGWETTQDHLVSKQRASQVKHVSIHRNTC